MVSQGLLKGLYASSLSRRNPLSPEPWPSAKNRRLISSCIILECVPTCKIHTVVLRARALACVSACTCENTYSVNVVKADEGDETCKRRTRSRSSRIVSGESRNSSSALCACKLESGILVKTSSCASPPTVPRRCVCGATMHHEA